MFMVSVKLTRKRMFLSALALVLVVSLGVIWARYSNNKNDVLPATTTKVEQTAEKVTSKKTAAKTNEQRLTFIQAFGWEVDEEPAEIMEVIIPKEFDEVYKGYNSIQKLQGCDLQPLSGKRCKRYSYTVVNYPGQTENVRINLIVYKNKIVGGDVCSLEKDGFMHGFEHE